MIIEERCKCGGEIKIVPDTAGVSRVGDAAAVAAAWKEVDRWRRLHRACLVDVPLAGPVEEGSRVDQEEANG